jgi:hypothetical protein
MSFSAQGSKWAEANRLINSRYTTGKVIYQEDFEALAAVTKFGFQNGGAGAAIALETGRSYSGKQSIKVTSATSAGADGGWSFQLATPALSTKIGVELYWHSNAGNALREQQFRIDYRNNSGMAQAGFQYRNYVSAAAVNKWQYLGADGSYHDVPGGGQVLKFVDGPYPWYHFKQIIDFADVTSPKYISLVSNGLSLNVASLVGYSYGAPDVNNVVEPVFLTHDDQGTAVNSWQDDLVVTAE